MRLLLGYLCLRSDMNALVDLVDRIDSYLATQSPNRPRLLRPAHRRGKKRGEHKARLMDSPRKCLEPVPRPPNPWRRLSSPDDIFRVSKGNCPNIICKVNLLTKIPLFAVWKHKA